ncbi:Tetracycline resistance protein TetA/multidrug resistance protein MdtG [Penicillium concentricum]|uniref:Tetracycline resistance protein TetA/multidrug resistance protein MdtG n=1 Tax=Penicillium concentricum TaxID=293559 RepID=A0A9W9S8B8_9EURO|nr:Tetracycline resistance protein TetA/multidrug resistance protein MdtG [Penicillium concentricum]KAJ5373245.1 Tetracycline resistance protein TetA/multidrug resistance protein MdtG [Penicillium concentricum]
MNDFYSEPTPIGYKWRSSKWFILSTITIALFAETFLYGFLVPILGYMFQSRLHIDPSETQKFTSAVLALHGAVSVISGPIIGHFADKSPNRKAPLLLSLLACIIGTVMIAGAPSVPILFIGRVMQGIAASAVWIVGFATIADTVDEANIGTVMGLTMSIVNLGMIGGPAVSGLLLEATGYWVTWLTPLLILTVDLIARLVMLESPPIENTPKDSPSQSKPSSQLEADVEETLETSETTSLLSPRQDSQIPSIAANFWRIMLCDARVLTVLLVIISGTTVGTSFHATLPLHVRETFGWGPGKTGFLFSCLIAPGLLLGPLAGWIRDRVGIRPPAVVALILQAVLQGLLGIAGSNRFSWANAQNWGETIYVASIMAIGATRPFMTGIGPTELTVAVKSHQEKNPGIFGPKGGLSRVFSMMEVAASLGMTIGPIIGGYLKEMVGYDYMSWTWSLLYLILAILVMSFLGSKNPDETIPSEEIQ